MAVSTVVFGRTGLWWDGAAGDVATEDFYSWSTT